MLSNSLRSYSSPSLHETEWLVVSGRCVGYLWNTITKYRIETDLEPYDISKTQPCMTNLIYFLVYDNINLGICMEFVKSRIDFCLTKRVIAHSTQRHLCVVT